MQKPIHFSHLLLLLIIILSNSWSLLGQKNELSKRIEQLKTSGVAFRQVDRLFEGLPPQKYPKNELERTSQRLKLQSNILQDLVSARPEAMTLRIPYRNSTLVVELYEQPVFADDFRVSTSESETVAVSKGVFYRGTIAGDEQSIAAISFFDNEVIGVISSQATGNLNLGRMDISGNTLDYALFPENALPAVPFNDCQTLEAHKEGEGAQRLDPSDVQVAGCVTIFF